MSGGSSGWGWSDCNEQINTINKLQNINREQSNTINTLTVAANYLNYIIQKADDAALKNIEAILVKAAELNANTYISNIISNQGSPGPSDDEATELHSTKLMYKRVYEEYINEIRNSTPRIAPDKLNK